MLSKNNKNITIFHMEITIFTVVKNIILLHRRVIVMSGVRRSEPRCEKTGLRGFRPGPTQTGLYNHRICLDA